MKNKCYKQNFYDLFGITYKGLAPIINRNELKCIPNTWYEPLDDKCIVNTADKIVVLSIDETIKTKLLEQSKKYNSMDGYFCNIDIIKKIRECLHYFSI